MKTKPPSNNPPTKSPLPLNLNVWRMNFALSTDPTLGGGYVQDCTGKYQNLCLVFKTFHLWWPLTYLDEMPCNSTESIFYTESIHKPNTSILLFGTVTILKPLWYWTNFMASKPNPMNDGLQIGGPCLTIIYMGLQLKCETFLLFWAFLSKSLMS